MKKLTAVLLLLALAFAALRMALAFADTGHTQANGPVRSVTEVVHGMMTNPKGWSGRAVRVRGVVTGVLCGLGCGPAKSTKTIGCVGSSCRTEYNIRRPARRRPCLSGGRFLAHNSGYFALVPAPILQSSVAGSSTRHTVVGIACRSWPGNPLDGAGGLQCAARMGSVCQ